MAKATVKMVTDSVEAFVQEDLDLAERVIDSDDEVDELFTKVKKELIDLIYAKDIDAKVALDLLMTAKYYERSAIAALRNGWFIPSQECIRAMNKGSEKWRSVSFARSFPCVAVILVISIRLIVGLLYGHFENQLERTETGSRLPGYCGGK